MPAHNLAFIPTDSFMKMAFKRLLKDGCGKQNVVLSELKINLSLQRHIRDIQIQVQISKVQLFASCGPTTYIIRIHELVLPRSHRSHARNLSSHDMVATTRHIPSPQELDGSI